MLVARMRGDGQPIGSHLPTRARVREQTVALYRAGESIETIEIATGLSRTTIWRIMKRHPLNRSIGREQRRLRRERHRELRRLHNALDRAFEPFRRNRHRT